VKTHTKILVSTLAVVVVLLAGSSGLRAQTEISLLAPSPIREPLEKSIAAFEAKTGDKVKVTWAVGSRDTEPYGTRQLVARGQAKDVSIMFAPFPEALASGNVDPKTATKICGIVLAVSVKKGTPIPDISSVPAVKKMLMSAKSIAIVEPTQGTLGQEGQTLLKRLGVADQLQAKIKAYAGSGQAEQAVAKGEADLFLGPQASDKFMAGLDLVMVGALPTDVSTPVDVVGFISTRASDPKAARMLLDSLKTADAEAGYKAAKFQPAD
jgi:molybdate transport system substrate-binding protein